MNSSATVDSFLPPEIFGAARVWADAAPYRDVTNPVDRVSYPDICTELPDWLREAVTARLTELEGRPVNVHFMFTRLSLAGSPCPHQAHTDSTMGARSAMLYLTRSNDCRGGTALVRHVTGFDRDPLGAGDHVIWARDTNRPEQWEITELCEMRANRAFLFDSRRMHRAEPVGGFGTTSQNGRLVLTTFYS
jgi:hypothetical protein